VSHVLIVEDQAPIQRLLREWLEADGASVITAVGAEQALLIATEQPPAVALCDIHLPGGRDGFWLAEQLRLFHPETAVIMTTGLPGFDEATAGPAGVTEYLLKPFTRQRLQQALQRALTEHDSRQASIAACLGEYAHATSSDADTVPPGATAALLTVLHAQRGSAYSHARRVSELAVTLARTLNLTEPEVSHIEHAALLRDIPRSDIYAVARKVPYLAAATEIAVASGERFDGAGFPLGLRGDAIPRGARIVAVAEAYDAVVTGDGLRQPTPADAVERLCGERAREFDPDVLRALRAVESELQPTAA